MNMVRCKGFTLHSRRRNLPHRLESAATRSKKLPKTPNGTIAPRRNVHFTSSTGGSSRTSRRHRAYLDLAWQKRHRRFPRYGHDEGRDIRGDVRMMMVGELCLGIIASNRVPITASGLSLLFGG